MTTWVGFLRGINVGGRRMAMADIVAALRDAGFDDVRTVLASGNVLLESPDDAATVRARIEAALTERFGYEARTQLRSVDEVARIAAEYPFERVDTHHAYVLVVDDPATREALLATPYDPAVEQIVPRDGVLYWSTPVGGTLDTPLGKAQGAPRYADTLTARNLNTVEKVLRAAGA